MKDIIIQPFYYDISIQADGKGRLNTPAGHTVFCYVYEGEVSFYQSSEKISPETLVLFEKGDSLSFQSDKPSRFLLIGGKPIVEPIAWRGPIVMNTREELDTAYRELAEGVFIK